MSLEFPFERWVQIWHPMFDFLNQVVLVGLQNPYVESSRVGVNPHDVCYPAILISFERLFPGNEFGGLICTCCGAAFYLLGAIALLRRFGINKTWVMLLVIGFSAQMWLMFYVGNLILYAAGAVCFFFSYYDSTSRSKRIFAALMLAMATVFKISPCLLGVLYLRKWSWQNFRMIFLAALVSLLFLVLPFAFYGGVDAFVAWLENATANSAQYATRNEFGIYGLVGEVSKLIGYHAEVMSAVWFYARIGSIVLASCCIGKVVFGKIGELDAILLSCFGLLYLPPTMMSYTVFYLLPILFVCVFSPDRHLKQLSIFAIVANCLPCQIYLPFSSLNKLFEIAATLDITFYRLKLNRQIG